MRPVIVLAFLFTAAAAGITIAAGGVDEKPKAEDKAEVAQSRTPRPATSPTAPAHVGATVRMARLLFAPESVDVRLGDAVRFRNDDNVAHHIVAEASAGGIALFESPDIKIGGDYDVALHRPGTYAYVCTLHPTVMHGRIVVSR